MNTMGPPIPGTLVLASAYRYVGNQGPFDFYACLSCGSNYPARVREPDSILRQIDAPPLLVTATIDPPRDIRCNGHTIELCPWCRPDSAPWTNGRGQ